MASIDEDPKRENEHVRAEALAGTAEDRDIRWFWSPRSLLRSGRGYLDRRWHSDDFVCQFSDQAVVAQELSNLLSAASTQEN